MRALVTGASGFVGTYLMDALRELGYDVVGTGGPHDGAGDHLPVDLADAQSLNAAFDIAQPDVVYHLAAQAFVPRALEAPVQTYQTNVIGTANVLLALRAYAARASMPRFLFVSSAEVYGVQPSYPVDERATLNPANPYAASKAAGEAIVRGEAQSFGIDAIITRAFNHIGPGQSDRFVVPSLAAQLAAIAAGGKPVLHVGNLQAQRDFLDVRDVVQAYIALAQRGVPGEVYNVCRTCMPGRK